MTYLQYSTAPEANFIARFSFVGAGNGDYELDTENIANEKVYRWIAPDTSTCAHQGSYAPIRRLSAPQQQRMLTAGGTYKIKGGIIKAEVAIANRI